MKKVASLAVLWVTVTVYGQPMNIALQKPASLSAEDYGGAAERGNDGNSDTHFENGASCVFGNPTVELPYPWWQVDLGQDYYIDEVAIQNRDYEFTYRLEYITIELYSEDPTVTASAQHQVCSVYNQTASGGERLVLQCAENTKGRYLRIQKKKNDIVNFCEVEVYGSPMPKNGRYVFSRLPGHKLTGPYNESTNTTLGCAKMCLQTAPCAGFSMDVALEAGQGTCQLFVVISVPAADPAWEAYVIIN